MDLLNSRLKQNARSIIFKQLIFINISTQYEYIELTS